jgi:hypothetical protein
MSAEDRQAVVMIPAGPTTVITEGSIYQLGEADKAEERSITRQPGSLSFTKCRVLVLAPGRSMILIIRDGPNTNSKWTTSPVKEIK